MKWVNEPNLDELQVSLTGAGLVVSDGIEKAHVRISEGRISSLTFSNGAQDWEVSSDQAKTVNVGFGNSARTVRHFLYPGGPATRLRLGQTFHDGKGTWSSLPHDFEMNPELGFEEFFQYQISGGSGVAHQVGRGVWRDGVEVDSIWTVSDGDFATIPMGYHPVVAEPEVSISYIWAYLVKSPHWEKI
ncbi:5-deoxy-glucuronate isomerase [Pontimonas sp.]|nr:5-deoxy-glucuronate isomerase [Pontimonas sp.]